MNFKLSNIGHQLWICSMSKFQLITRISDSNKEHDGESLIGMSGTGLYYFGPQYPANSKPSKSIPTNHTTYLFIQVSGVGFFEVSYASDSVAAANESMRNNPDTHIIDELDMLNYDGGDTNNLFFCAAGKKTDIKIAV